MSTPSRPETRPTPPVKSGWFIRGLRGQPAPLARIVLVVLLIQAILLVVALLLLRSPLR